MRLTEFIHYKLGQLFLHGISIAALTIFLYFTGTSTGALTLILIAWITGFAIILLFNYHNENTRLNELESIMNGLDKKYLFMECVKKPTSVYERKIFSLVRRSGKAMIEAVSDAQNQQKEYREYIENWVHEIKAPITAAQLICANNKSESVRKLLPQLAQIEEHVERALYYARAGSVEKDFIIRKVVLADIVNEAVARHQPVLIHCGAGIETSGLDTVVYTDGKWVSFMLGQLLSNAIRYRSENPVIRFEAKNNNKHVVLNITDNGIGIPSHELPRIFERGFTGSNGRERGGSTGMGLYIFGKLADFLQIELNAESAKNEYTTISMTFPAKENLTKM